MSRPIPSLLLLLPVLAVPLSGCKTPYSRMYSPAKSHYKAPPEAPKKSDADKLPPPTPDVLGLPPGGLPPGGLLPPDLPPAPAGDPAAPAPMADPLNAQPPPAPPPL